MNDLYEFLHSHSLLAFTARSRRRCSISTTSAAGELFGLSSRSFTRHSPATAVAVEKFSFDSPQRHGDDFVFQVDSALDGKTFGNHLSIFAVRPECREKCRTLVVIDLECCVELSC